MLHVQGCRMGLPALVQPLAELCSDELSRYSRHVLLPELGLNGQRRLKTSRVLVIGAGGLGSPVLLYLAAAGVGTLGIVEFDVVEASNLQRQVIHGVSSVGCSKAESAQQAIAEINPYVRVCLHKERFEVSNALALLADYDLVVDGTDNFATRYLINDACVLARKPYVWGSVFRFEGQASVFWEHAPEGRGLNYRDVYPEPPPPELAPSCSEGGVLGVVCASIGSIMATEAVKLITGVGESLLGRLAVFDALDMTYRFMPLRPARHRKQIEQFEDYQALCGLNTLTKTLDVPTVTFDELQVWRSQGVGFQLIDVRERNEWDIVRMPDALHVQKDHLLKPAFLAQIKPETPVVLYCKSGARSAKAVALLQAQGFLNVHSLQGGVLAWVREVAPSLPTY